MLQKDKYSVINIRKYLESDDPRLGEEDLIQILSEFSCEKNPDVERFLKKSSIEFTKKNQSITYIVLSIDDGELLGYFTIALKPLTVRGETVSNTVKKKLLRISELDEETQTYTMSAYLIAQLGKNFTNGANEKITGAELLEAAWNKVEEIQYQAGGVVTFLEANDDAKLLSFYNDNKFVKFDTRQTTSGSYCRWKKVEVLKRKLKRLPFLLYKSSLLRTKSLLKLKRI